MYRLDSLEKLGSKPIKKISKEVFEELKSDCETIKNCHKQFEVFNYLQYNIKEYWKFVEKTSNLPTGEIDIQKLSNFNTSREVNIIILNFLSSFKFFLDNAETHLKRKFGKQSKIANNFEQLKRDYFDNHFAYRFLYKLRNYYLHLGFPISGISFEAEKNVKNPENMRGDLCIEIDKEILLKEKDLFATVHKDLLRIKESEINLKPLIKTLSEIILEIQKFIYETQKDELEEAIDNIEMFSGEYKNNQNSLGITMNIKSDKYSSVISFDFYKIPFEFIAEFKNYRRNSC